MYKFMVFYLFNFSIVYIFFSLSYFSEFLLCYNFIIYKTVLFYLTQFCFLFFYSFYIHIPLQNNSIKIFDNNTQRIDM